MVETHLDLGGYRELIKEGTSPVPPGKPYRVSVDKEGNIELNGKFNYNELSTIAFHIYRGAVKLDKCQICKFKGLSDLFDPQCPICGSDDVDDVSYNQYE